MCSGLVPIVCPIRRRRRSIAVTEVRQIATAVTTSWRNDILAKAAGITAGSWYASGAGMLILASDGRRLPLDYGELER